MPMKQLSLFLSSSLFSSVICILLYKYLRLTLTLPLVVIGGVLLFSQINSKCGLTKTLLLNLGALVSAIGIIFSVLNLITISGAKEPVVRREGDYETSMRMLKGKYSMGLGYVYPPGLKNFSSRMVAYSSGSTKNIVYDVLYNIDSLGNRFTPFVGDNAPKKTNSILFLGDSLTFGEGLSDDETLSYFIQARTGRAALNAGLHGYGAHQSLRILEDQDLYDKRTSGHDIKTIVYRSIVEHIHRTAGYSSWDSYGPCYELTPSKTVSYRGSFAECGKSDNSFSARLKSRLMSTSEPFTRQVLDRLMAKRVRSDSSYLPNDVERYISVVSRMNSIAKGKGIKFLIVLEDAGTYDEFCGDKVPYADELTNRFRRERLSLVLTSDLYTKEVCTANSLTISKYDRHPTMIANKLLSDYLIANKFIY